MVRGSTPTFTFVIPFNVSQIKNLYVTTEQKVGTDVIQIEKSIDECELQGTKVSCRFTQEDTLKLKENKHANVQLRVLTHSDEALVSDVFEVAVNELLKEGVIE